MKKVLKEVSKYPKEIKIRKGYVQEMRTKMSGVNGIDYSKDRLSGGNNSPDHRLVKLLYKVIEQERAIEDLESKIKELEQAVNKIDNSEERQVVILRYLRGYSWERVCSELYISYATAKRRNVSALEKLKNFIS